MVQPREHVMVPHQPESSKFVLLDYSKCAIRCQMQSLKEHRYKQILQCIESPMDVNSLVITIQDAKCTTTKNMNNFNVYSSLPTSAIELGLQKKERTNERGEADEQLVWVRCNHSSNISQVYFSSFKGIYKHGCYYKTSIQTKQPKT